jgi:hypothetical protein
MEMISLGMAAHGPSLFARIKFGVFFLVCLDKEIKKID